MLLYTTFDFKGVIRGPQEAAGAFKFKSGTMVQVPPTAISWSF